MLEFFTAQINNGHTRRAYLLNGGSVENAHPRRPIEVRHPIARRADEYLVLRQAVSDASSRPITSSQGDSRGRNDAEASTGDTSGLGTQASEKKISL